jgi:DNA repair exonuclease SbcCD ATPase subunit
LCVETTSVTVDAMVDRERSIFFDDRPSQGPLADGRPLLEVLRRPRLDTGRRGYETKAVDELLTAAADAIQRLENEVSGASLIVQQRDAELTDLRGRFQPMSDALAEREAQLSAANQALQESMAAANAARQAADEATHDARLARQLAAAAPPPSYEPEPAPPAPAAPAASDEAALIVLQQARETATAALAEAQRIADDLKLTAEAESERLRDDARREAAMERRSAKEAVAAINDEAERRLEEMDRELAERRLYLEGEITTSEQRLTDLNDMLTRRSQLLANEARRLAELADRLAPAGSDDEIDLTEPAAGATSTGTHNHDSAGDHDGGSRLAF